MKIVTAREYELITSAIGEGLTSCPEGVIESDLLNTVVLRHRIIAQLSGVRLLFGEGTWFSKVPVMFTEAKAVFLELAEQLLGHEALAEIGVSK